MADTDTRTVSDEGPAALIELVATLVEVPLLSVHRSAHGSEALRRSIVLEWRRVDGVVGSSECPTLSRSGYVTETTDRAWAALDSCDALLEASGGGAVPALTAALSDAALDAELRAASVSLSEHLGVRRASVPRTAVLAQLGSSPVALAESAALAVENGAAMVKVKIAPGADHAVLREVVAAVGDPRRVAADANGSYGSAADLRTVDVLGLRYLEQPFGPHHSATELAELAATLTTPVALDESVTSVALAAELLEQGAGTVVSIKPARVGGVQQAALLAALAARRGAAAFVGGMFELGLGRAAAAAVAALDAVDLPSDLGPSAAYVARDICEPIIVDVDGDLLVPQGPGSGRRPDAERLAEFAVDRRRLVPDRVQAERLSRRSNAGHRPRPA